MSCKEITHFSDCNRNNVSRSLKGLVKEGDVIKKEIENKEKDNGNWRKRKLVYKWRK